MDKNMKPFEVVQTRRESGGGIGWTRASRVLFGLAGACVVTVAVCALTQHTETGSAVSTSLLSNVPRLGSNGYPRNDRGSTSRSTGLAGRGSRPKGEWGDRGVDGIVQDLGKALAGVPAGKPLPSSEPNNVDESSYLLKMGLVQQTLPRNSGLQQSQSWDLSAPQTRFLSMPTSAGPASALASSTSSEEKARTQRLVWYDKEGRAHYWGWEDEGLPHEGMPASAIQQTRQALSDALAQVLAQERRAEQIERGEKGEMEALNRAAEAAQAGAEKLRAREHALAEQERKAEEEEQDEEGGKVHWQEIEALGGGAEGEGSEEGEEGGSDDLLGADAGVGADSGDGLADTGRR